MTWARHGRVKLRSCQRPRSPSTARGLTLRSSGKPTARRAGHRAQGLRPILRSLSSAPRCWRPLSFTLGCIARAGALPPSPNAKSMRASRPAALKSQANRDHLGCGARLAGGAFSRSALSHLGTNQIASTSPEAWCAGAGRKLRDSKSRAQPVRRRSNTQPRQAAHVPATLSPSRLSRVKASFSSMVVQARSSSFKTKNAA